MKSIDKIPTGKIQRASKLIATGAKIGVNYAKYYGEKLLGEEESKAKDKLNESNAEDIYDGLKDLKGSALKIAQMISMEKNMMPKAYVEKFSLAQFSVPPLSPPLVIKTFRNYFNTTPDKLFDEFDLEACNAASIGQVHRAKKNGRNLAVKIQYPGVRESIVSDLSLVKPIAIRMFNIQKKGSEKYFKEVENKLLEETDYALELAQSQEIRIQCQHIPNLKIPNYYPEFSSDRILTMDWMEGKHLSQYKPLEHSPETNRKIGQALWDFYMFQIHQLRKVHADPHPGNFLVNKNNELVALDFGCMKTIPKDFYTPYFDLVLPENLHNPQIFQDKLYALEILLPEDTPEEKAFFTQFFHRMLALFTQPFQQDFFDFSDDTFFDEIAKIGEQISQDPEIRKRNNNRGSKHFIYMNRTFFGLYHLMHELRAQSIRTNAMLPKK